MKKRIFALMLALCLALAMMPVPAFAEGEVTEPSTETVVPEEGKKPEEPVTPEETKKSEEPVIPEETKKSEEPVVPEETKKSEEPVIPEEKKKPEEPVIPEETKKSEEPVIPEETKKPEEPLTPAEPSAAEKVQALIDALPETVTADVTYTAKWKAKTYTVTFDPNGGTGTMADQTLTYDKAEKLTKNAFTREGYTFNGWKDQTGTTYYDEEEVTHPDPSEKGIYLSAQWKLNSYTISFDANGGEGTMDTIPMTYDTAANLTANVFTRTGYTFTGWNTQADGTGTGYTDGQEVTNLTAKNGETVTLYAQWKAHSYTISFDANGGKGDMANQTMTYGQTAKLTAIGFTRDGYRFTGWNTQADGKGSVSFADEAPVSNLTTVDNDKITLYAQWVKVIDRVDLSLSGHGLDKKVEDVKVTTKDDISFSVDNYGDGWGITKASNNLTALGGQLFRADTQYYLFVTFSAKEGCTLEGLTPKDVFLDGRAAQSLTVEQGTVTAVFRLPVIYTIETSAGKNGTIDPEGTVAVFEGQDVEIKITPNKGYVVYRLTVDGKNVKTARTYTFKNVQESHTIHARFLKNGDNAKTGDSFPMGIALGAVTLSAAALAALFFLRKRKQTR